MEERRFQVRRGEDLIFDVPYSMAPNDFLKDMVSGIMPMTTVGADYNFRQKYAEFILRERGAV